MSIFHDLADYAAEEIVARLRESCHGTVDSYNIDEENEIITFNISFRGWYEREKTIDNIYCRIKVNRTMELSVSTREIELVWKERGKYYTEKVATVIINWRNLDPEEEVPVPMRNCLSGVSYEHYLTF